MVLPVLSYGCEIWAYEDCKIVESLHLKFCKYILGLKKSTCNVMVYGELGRYPLEIELKVRLVSYWARLLRGKQDKIAKVMYDALYRSYVNNDYMSKWLLGVRDILQSCGLNYVWLNQEDGINAIFVKNTVKRILQEQFVQNWQGKALINVLYIAFTKTSGRWRNTC